MHLLNIEEGCGRTTVSPTATGSGGWGRAEDQPVEEWVRAGRCHPVHRRRNRQHREQHVVAELEEAPRRPDRTCRLRARLGRLHRQPKA